MVKILTIIVEFECQAFCSDEYELKLKSMTIGELKKLFAIVKYDWLSCQRLDWSAQHELQRSMIYREMSMRVSIYEFYEMCTGKDLTK